jgi:hypothetical protein
MKTLTIPIFVLVQALFLHQSKHDNSEFIITLGSCFNLDSVNVKLQGIQVAYKRIKSGAIGKANLSFIQGNKHLSVFYNGQEKKLKKIGTKPSLKMEFDVGGQQYTCKFDLKNGKYFLVDYCGKNPTGNKVITVQQQTEPFLFL